MTDTERVPLIELLPHDENLPDKVKDKDISLITSVVLRTVWGWKRSTKISVAQAEYFNSLANVADAIYRYNESTYRLGTAGPRVARDAEIEKLEHEARKTDLEYEIKKKQLALGRLDKENLVEVEQLDGQLSGYKKGQTSKKKGTDDDFLTKKEREAEQAAKRYVAGLTRIKPKLDEADRIVDELLANNQITEDKAKEAREELRGIYTDGFLRL
jgi:hypothetical protein